MSGLRENKAHPETGARRVGRGPRVNRDLREGRGRRGHRAPQGRLYRWMRKLSRVSWNCLESGWA